MRIGQIVVRKSYEKDIIFKIIGFKIDDKNKKVAMLKGLAFRIIADAYIEDLELVNATSTEDIIIDKQVEGILYKSMGSVLERDKISYRLNRTNKTNPNIYGMPGKVLQIDGDKEYLKICLDVYTQLGIPAVGVSIPEADQHKEVKSLLEKHNPDILVITGHDAMTSKKNKTNDISNYKNSANFIKTVKEARKWQPNQDSLVIFAGACQSNYEMIIKSGANYASSPGRIMIHALDPVFVVEKIACSRLDVTVPIDEVIDQTVTGMKGVGGFETRGKFRWAMPKSMLY